MPLFPTNESHPVFQITSASKRRRRRKRLKIAPSDSAQLPSTHRLWSRRRMSTRTTKAFLAIQRLERNVLVTDGRGTRWGRLRLALVEIVSAGGGSRTAREAAGAFASSFATAAEQDQVAGHDFGHPFLLAGG